MKAKTLRLRMTAGLLGCAVAMGLAGTAAAQPVKTVRVWHTETNPASQKAVAEIVKRFEATRPGVKIEAEALSWNDLEGKIMAALAAGSPPELSHGQPVTCAALQSKNLLLPLDDVVKAVGEDNIWARYKKICVVDGKWYGVVHASGTSLMIYRKDLAKKLGIEPPKTWDDFVKIAEKLTIDENKDGKPEIYGLTMPGDNLFINILVGEMMAANGGKLFDEKNRPLFESKADAGNAGLLEAALEIHAAGLGRPRLSRHLLQPVRAEGGDDVCRLRPRRLADRAVCAGKHAQHRDL